ncbi:MAG TPA: hypothetical protein VNV87_01415 [Acidimicrobiales bacterium]|jgi:hypothetical protein|nr:hypothetical protein [Acidimicrobiales bacterium]
MQAQYAGKARADKTAVTIVLMFAGLAVVLLLLVMHGIDQRAYNSCVQHVEQTDGRYNPITGASLANTSSCIKAWP